MIFWCLRFPPKHEWKQVDLRYHSSIDEFFRSFFGGNRRHQKPFQNYLIFRSQNFFFKFMAKFYIKSDFQFQFLMLMSKWGHFLDIPIRACINVLVVGKSKQLIPTWEIILKQNIYTWNWYANYVMVSGKPDVLFMPISNIITKTNFCCLDWKQIITILSSKLYL